MPTTSIDYPAGNRSVRVDVVIGDGQTGGSALFLGEELVAQGGREVHEIDLGPGDRLRGKVMVVSTTVVDIRAEHDRASTRVRLHGGTPDPMPVVQTATAQPGGAVSFLTVVRFV